MFLCVVKVFSSYPYGRKYRSFLSSTIKFAVVPILLLKSSPIMIWSDFENLANCSCISWRTLHSSSFVYVELGYYIHRQYKCYFYYSRNFSQFDPDYIFISFIKYRYCFVEFIAEVNYTHPLPLLMDGLFFSFYFKNKFIQISIWMP